MNASQRLFSGVLALKNPNSHGKMPTLSKRVRDYVQEGYMTHVRAIWSRVPWARDGKQPIRKSVAWNHHRVFSRNTLESRKDPGQFTTQLVTKKLVSHVIWNIIKILTAREGNKGNCHSSKTNVNLSFLGVTISHVTLSFNQ